MQTADTATYSFRDKLIDEIIDDQKVRRRLHESKEKDEFIESLVKNYVDEIAPVFKDKVIMKSKREKLKGLGASAKSLVDCVDYAYILFLTRSFSERDTYPWIREWLAKERGHHPDSAILKFLNARVALSYTEIDAFKENEANIQEEAFNDLKNVLQTAYEPVIKAMLILDSIMLHTLERHDDILDWYYTDTSQGLFPEVSKELYPKAVSSFYHAICSEYYKIAGKKDEQNDELYKSLDLYDSNSLAVVEKAYITCIKANKDIEEAREEVSKKERKEARKKAEKDRREAKKMFEKSLNLAEKQFRGYPLTRVFVQAWANAGLAYLLSKSAQYSKAKGHYRDALLAIDRLPESLSPSMRYVKSFILLNRGRSELDNGRYADAKKDFDEASKNPELLPYVESNRGIIYYKQTWNGKARSKFNRAIELKPDLAEAYYNLGVVYNEEGRKQKAVRLFNTALEIDGELREAYDALEKLEGLDVGDIRDWYNWWFGRETTRYKKGLGTVLVALILFGISSTIYDIRMGDSDISGSIFGVLGFALIFLVLPLITKLKLGNIEVEMESKGQNPLGIANGPNLKPVGGR